MPPTYKLIEHARKHRNRTKIEKVKDHTAYLRANITNTYSPPYAPAYEPESPPYAPAYVPESPPYAPAYVPARRSNLRRSPSGSRRRHRVSHSDLKEVQEYELENEVDDSGNVHQRWFHPSAIFSKNPGLMKTRTGAVVGDEPERSWRYLSTEGRLNYEHGPCHDESARRELVRVLDSMRGVQAAIDKHAEKSGGGADHQDFDAYFMLQAELDELAQQKRVLFERCGYDPAFAFGRLKKAAKKNPHKRKKYERLMRVLML